MSAARRKPSTFREGVLWCADINVDAFFITLKKTETDYSPTTMYRDFALSPELFHWESQSTTAVARQGLAARPPAYRSGILQGSRHSRGCWASLA